MLSLILKALVFSGELLDHDSQIIQFESVFFLYFCDR